MRGTDIEVLGDLAGDALWAGGGVVREMHLGIASRPFGILGPVAAPVRVLHDGISEAVYAGVRRGLRVGARGGAALLARRATEQGPALAATPAGSVALGAVNALLGDQLSAREHRLALGMVVRRGGRDVAMTAAGLATAFPDASPRVAVFVHGLFGDDEAWRRLPLRGERAARRTYGERLQEELGVTPVTIRYNSGLPVSRNGRTLARLLDELVGGWPTTVEEIVLIGHSMGGLVVRSAGRHGARVGHRWTSATSHVVSLGGPHLGADLEKGVHIAGWALNLLPETRALGALLNARSVGIKDLRRGDRGTGSPSPADARHCFIGSTVTDGVVGGVLGDGLVRLASASGRGRGTSGSVLFDDGRELRGLTHMALLNHPAVYEQLRTWITRGSTPPG